MTAGLLGGGLLVMLAGLGIGATSIGGVLVVPALTLLAGVALPTAIAASSLAFLATGLWAMASVRRSGFAQAGSNPALLMSALVGAAVGASLTSLAPAPWVRAWIGALALASGLYGLYGLWRLRRGMAHAAPLPWPGALAQAGIGLVVGFGSALSGTGGPVMLLPWLMLTRRSVDRAIAAGLMLQVPIALAASTAHAAAGRIDWSLSAIVAALLVVGVAAGRPLARRLSPGPLQACAALLLVVTGVWFLLA
jgi:uncharacterized protein